MDLCAYQSGAFRADLRKYYRIEFGGRPPTLRRRVKLWITHLGLHCVAVYRLGRFARAVLAEGNPAGFPLFILYEALAFFVKAIHHVDIFAASIGPGFYIGHVGTIYIGKTRIGSNCSVTHNVTIGMGISGCSHGVPTLGDDVWVGAGSLLSGSISLGRGVAVNGGTFLTRSVPDRCLVGGNPGRVILTGYDNSALFGGRIPPDAARAAEAGKADESTPRAEAAV